MKKSHSTKISEILPKLEDEIKKVDKIIAPIKVNSRWSKKRAFTSLIVEDYNEVVLIFKRILSYLKEIEDIDIFGKNRTEDNISEPEIDTLMLRHSNTISYLKVEIKSIYVWTALINDIFKNCEVEVNLKELERISLFHHKFITHIHNESIFKSALARSSIVSTNSKEEYIEVFYFPITFKKNQLTGFDKLVKQAESFIPELSQEENVFNRIKILYRQESKISDKIVRRNVRKFILKVGVPTDSPGVIAKALLDTLKSYSRNV